MRQLSENAKKAIVQKALTQDGRSLRELAGLHNISKTTLHNWIKQYRNDDIIIDISPGKRDRFLSSAERFSHLMATSSMDEGAIGVYCREHGLYSFQLKQWKEAFMAEQSNEKKPALQSELKSLRDENKRLKQELKRKDSALAEASALLILKKKAALIWGESEDD